MVNLQDKLCVLKCKGRCNSDATGGVEDDCILCDPVGPKTGEASPAKEKEAGQNEKEGMGTRRSQGPVRQRMVSQ